MTFAAGEVIRPQFSKTLGYFASQSVGAVAVYKICDTPKDAVLSGTVFPKRYRCTCNQSSEPALLYAYYEARKRAYDWEAEVCWRCKVICAVETDEARIHEVPNISNSSDLLFANLQNGARVHLRLAGRAANESAVYISDDNAGIQAKLNPNGKTLKIKWDDIMEFWPMP